MSWLKQSKLKVHREVRREQKEKKINLGGKTCIVIVLKITGDYRKSKMKFILLQANNLKLKTLGRK